MMLAARTCLKRSVGGFDIVFFSVLGKILAFL